MSLRTSSLLILVSLSFSLPLQSRGSDQCSDLFTRDLLRADKSYGSQAFKRQLGRLDRALSDPESLSWDEELKNLLDQDSRKILFRLRILSQTYHAKEVEFFDKREAIFKNIEYLLGRVELYEDISEQLVLIGEPHIAEFFRSEKNDSAQKLRSALQDFDLEKLTHDYHKYHWDDGNKDRKFLIHEAIEFAESLEARIQKNSFDSDDLEKGLHALRRRLRELAYRVGNLDGFVKLVEDEKLSPELRLWFNELKIRNPEITSSIYLPAGVPQIDNPIKVGLLSLSILNQIVADIGKTKDHSEDAFYIEKYLDDVRVSPEDRKRIVEKIRKIRSQSIDQRVLANRYQQRLRDTRLLEAIASFIKEHN